MQIKDPARNARGRSLEELVRHIGTASLDSAGRGPAEIRSAGRLRHAGLQITCYVADAQAEV